MKRVVHLIPYDGIGGVEIAAKSIDTGEHGELHFARHYMVGAAGREPAPGEYHGPEVSLNGPQAYWHALRALLRNPPDLLVASLWRGAIVMILFKLLRPGRKAVIFLHYPGTVHSLDRAVNLLAMRLADEIWADSQATLDRRVPRGQQRKGQVISFLTSREAMPEIGDPKPVFVFWGRLNTQKGLSRALGIFHEVVKREPGALFTIAGPDGGEEAQLRADAARRGIADRVTFLGPVVHDQIRALARRANFYLQPSLNEGMAMSVVEAMQSGLVPVVTPVGEIAHYCQAGENAVVLRDDSEAVDDIIELLKNPARYRAMATSAAEYWQNRPLYRDDFLLQAGRLLD